VRVENADLRRAQSLHFTMTLELLVRLLCRTQPYMCRGRYLWIQLQPGHIAEVALSDDLRTYCVQPTEFDTAGCVVHRQAGVFQAMHLFANTPHQAECVD
jgi:hypothetical protein